MWIVLMFQDLHDDTPGPFYGPFASEEDADAAGVELHDALGWDYNTAPLIAEPV